MSSDSWGTCLELTIVSPETMFTVQWVCFRRRTLWSPFNLVVAKRIFLLFFFLSRCDWIYLHFWYFRDTLECDAFTICLKATFETIYAFCRSYPCLCPFQWFFLYTSCVFLCKAWRKTKLNPISSADERKPFGESSSLRIFLLWRR